MCSYNAIQSGTLNTKRERERCVPFHLYSPISPPFSRTHSLSQSLSLLHSLYLSRPEIYLYHRTDAAKERKVCCTRRSRRRRRCPCCLARPAAPAWPAAAVRPAAPGNKLFRWGKKISRNDRDRARGREGGKRRMGLARTQVSYIA